MWEFLELRNSALYMAILASFLQGTMFALVGEIQELAKLGIKCQPCEVPRLHNCNQVQAILSVSPCSCGSAGAPWGFLVVMRRILRKSNEWIFPVRDIWHQRRLLGVLEMCRRKGVQVVGAQPPEESCRLPSPPPAPHQCSHSSCISGVFCPSSRWRMGTSQVSVKSVFEIGDLLKDINLVWVGRWFGLGRWPCFCKCSGQQYRIWS